MPSAAKKLAIVHNDEPAPDQQPSQELSNEAEATVESSDEIVEIAVEEIVEVSDAGQEPAQRPEALRLLEAMLFAAADPLDEATLKRALPDGVDIKFSLVQLQQEYATRGVNLVRVGKKWTFRTAGDLSWLLTKQTVETRKLSRAAIETMAIVAYHQPVTRAEIEEIRGVQTATGTLDVLLKTGWIRPRGRRKAPGRPITYGTTEHFLSHFGLEEVGDLPGLDELKGAGLLEGNMPDGFGVPMPSDDASLRDDEEPLEPGDLELDLGLAPPEGQVEKAEQSEAGEQGEQADKPEK
jgi:segregation and condensation protein B